MKYKNVYKKKENLKSSIANEMSNAFETCRSERMRIQGASGLRKRGKTFEETIFSFPEHEISVFGTRIL